MLTSDQVKTIKEVIHISFRHETFYSTTKHHKTRRNGSTNLAQKCSYEDLAQ